MLPHRDGEGAYRRGAHQALALAGTLLPRRRPGGLTPMPPADRTPHDAPALRARGRVTCTRTVWCHDCPESFTATAHASRTAAEYEWMGHGWGRIGAWLCPDCLARRTKALWEQNYGD